MRQHLGTPTWRSQEKGNGWRSHDSGEHLLAWHGKQRVVWSALQGLHRSPHDLRIRLLLVQKSFFFCDKEPRVFPPVVPEHCFHTPPPSGRSNGNRQGGVPLRVKGDAAQHPDAGPRVSENFRHERRLNPVKRGGGLSRWNCRLGRIECQVGAQMSGYACVCMRVCACLHPWSTWGPPSFPASSSG